MCNTSSKQQQIYHLGFSFVCFIFFHSFSKSFQIHKREKKTKEKKETNIKYSI